MQPDDSWILPCIVPLWLQQWSKMPHRQIKEIKMFHLSTYQVFSHSFGPISGPAFVCPQRRLNKEMLKSNSKFGLADTIRFFCESSNFLPFNTGNRHTKEPYFRRHWHFCHFWGLLTIYWVACLATVDLKSSCRFFRTHSLTSISFVFFPDPIDFN